MAVQRVLGHSVPSTTLNLYSHVVEGGRENNRGPERDATPGPGYQGGRCEMSVAKSRCSDQLQPKCNHPQYQVLSARRKSQ